MCENHVLVGSYEIADKAEYLQLMVEQQLGEIAIDAALVEDAPAIEDK